MEPVVVANTAEILLLGIKNLHLGPHLSGFQLYHEKVSDLADGRWPRLSKHFIFYLKINLSPIKVQGPSHFSLLFDFSYFWYYSGLSELKGEIALILNEEEEMQENDRKNQLFSPNLVVLETSKGYLSKPSFS